jgi:hypothetical protein
MKLYYHKTDGGAEYYCTGHIDGSEEGDMRTAVLRTDGEEFELNTYKLAQLGLDVIIKS